MTSEAVRNPVKDQLLTPQDSALIIIDYQPIQVTSVASMDRCTLVSNIVAVARTAKLYGLPIVLSTVNVKTGMNQPTIHQLQEILPGVESFDRTTINAWEGVEFVKAVKAAGRKKLVMAALWTEACLTFPALDALSEGYEVFPVVDAVRGTSAEAHHAALERMTQAGTRPVSWVQLLRELQRDSQRKETAQQIFCSPWKATKGQGNSEVGLSPFIIDSVDSRSTKWRRTVSSITCLHDGDYWARRV
jgi:nicotinamidase-related amidase